MSGLRAMVQPVVNANALGSAPIRPLPAGPSEDRPADTPFLFSQQQRRLPGAMVASFILHAGVFLIAISVPNWGPRVIDSGLVMSARVVDAGIVWLRAPGPGGGGGGGGNRQQAPPRKIEMPGRDKISVPIAKPATMVAPTTIKDSVPTPPIELTIPAKPMAAGSLDLAGILDTSSTGSSRGPGTGGGAGTGNGTGIGPGDGSGLGPGSGGGTGGGVYRPGAGIENPVVTREVKPNYTPDAMRAKIQGVVWLEGVVGLDGTLSDLKVVRSLDAVFGLDQEALKAARQWRFIPGKRLGQPVAVLISIEMTFTLH